MSSGDSGLSWELEATLFYGRDMREPFFLSINGRLVFSFFQGGTNPIDFEPFGLFRMERLRPGEWTEPELYGHDGEVVWEIVKENGTAYSQSYSGNYSTPGDAQDLGKLDMFLNVSTDGIDWTPAGEKEIVYHGGITELGFYFDLEVRSEADISLIRDINPRATCGESGGMRTVTTPGGDRGHFLPPAVTSLTGGSLQTSPTPGYTSPPRCSVTALSSTWWLAQIPTVRSGAATILC